MVRLSALRTGRLYPQECSWYSFSLGAESTPGPWYGQKEKSLKNPVTPPGIDPGTVRLVAQQLNHYATPEKSSSGDLKLVWTAWQRELSLALSDNTFQFPPLQPVVSWFYFHWNIGALVYLKAVTSHFPMVCLTYKMPQKFDVQWEMCLLDITTVCERKEKISSTFFK